MSTGTNRYVFFDLDHTLYESTISRSSHVKYIFRKYFDIERFPWAIYYSIRDKYRIFDLVYNNSFFHYWLSPQLIALLLGIIKGDLRLKKVMTILNRVENNIDIARFRYVRPGAFIIKSNDLLGGDMEFQDLVHYINRNSRRKPVKTAAFDYDNSLVIKPYPGIKEGIHHLNKMGINCYVTSEGVYALQKLKLQKLSIGNYFRNKLLASEIYTSNRYYRDSMAIINNAIAEGTYWKKYYTKEIVRADETIRNFWILKSKEKRYYYIAALNAIQENPRNPENVLKNRNSNELMDASGGTFDKLIMFGDRVEKDVYPLWQLYGDRITFIRIKKGRFMESGIDRNISINNYNEFLDPTKAIKYATQIVNKW